MLSTGLGFPAGSARCLPAGDWNTLESGHHRPSGSSRPGLTTGRWTVDTGPCGWRIGQWDANPASQRRTCRLGFTATPSVPVGGNTYSSLTNLKPPSLPSSGRLVIVPPHSVCSQRVAFPRNIWGAPASCRQISVKNWQWGTRFSSGKMGAPSPGSTEELPPPPTPSSVPPSLPPPHLHRGSRRHTARNAPDRADIAPP